METTVQMDAKNSIAVMLLIALMGTVQAITLSSGLTLNQGNTNYTVLNSFSYIGDLNFTTDGLIISDYTIKVNPSAGFLTVGFYTIGLDYMDYQVNPNTNAIIEFNITGFTDDTKIFIYRDGVIYNTTYADGLGFINFESNSFTTSKRFLFTKTEEIIVVDDLTTENAINQLTSNLMDALTVNQFVCQVQIDDNSDFSSVDVDKQVFITEYTHMNYIEPGTYYVRVRCKQNEVWSFWSKTESFMHGNKPIVIDWTIQ